MPASSSQSRNQAKESAASGASISSAASSVSSLPPAGVVKVRGGSVAEALLQPHFRTFLAARYAMDQAVQLTTAGAAAKNNSNQSEAGASSSTEAVATVATVPTAPTRKRGILAHGLARNWEVLHNGIEIEVRLDKPLPEGSIPIFLTSLVGSKKNGAITGATSVYDTSIYGFKCFVKSTTEELNMDKINERNYMVMWICFGI